jgi:hypothetical protein
MRLRRASLLLLRCVGLIVVAALLVAWGLSAITMTYYLSPSGDWVANLAGGRVGVGYAPGMIAQFEQRTGTPTPRGVQSLRVPTRMQWLPNFQWRPAEKGIGIPLWCPLVLVGSLLVKSWWKDVATRRRARLGGCNSCHYSRDGLDATAPCPECGAPGLAPTKS